MLKVLTIFIFTLLSIQSTVFANQTVKTATPLWVSKAGWEDDQLLVKAKIGADAKALISRLQDYQLEFVRASGNALILQVVGNANMTTAQKKIYILGLEKIVSMDHDVDCAEPIYIAYPQ